MSVSQGMRLISSSAAKLITTATFLTALCLSLFLTSCALAQSCIPVNGEGGNYKQTTDNIASYSSPFTYLDQNGTPSIVYTDHNTGHLFIDGGYSQMPFDSGIAVSTAGLGDITAATQPGYIVTYAFLSPTLGMALVQTQGTPTDLYYPYKFTIKGAGTFNNNFTPTLILYDEIMYAAYVVGNTVYLASSGDGTFWNQIGAVSTITTISRPSLAIFNGVLYVGYTNAQKQPVIGPVQTNTTFAPQVEVQPGSFGNSNHNGVYAGIAMAEVGNSLYVFGQSVGSANTLYETSSATGASFPLPVNCGAQLRYTPSVINFASELDLVFQGNYNTYLWIAALIQ